MILLVLLIRSFWMEVRIMIATLMLRMKKVLKPKKFINSVIKGDLTLAAKVKTGFGDNDKAKALRVFTGVDVNSVNSSAVQGKRNVINDLTERPTFDSTVSDESGIKSVSLNCRRCYN